MEQLCKLADYLACLSYQNIPEEARIATIHCIIDTVSVAGGAVNAKLVEDIRKTYLSFSGKDAEYSSSIWGTDLLAPLPAAVFLNGLAGHYYELDDVHCESKTHIGTVVVPAAYGLAEALGSSGKELICAIVCGYEAMARIGVAFGVVSHRELGWHSTATAGVFGAAAACAKLLKLTPDQFSFALGMAGTQSFGRWAFLGEGATCKSLHAARAASSGCEAAFLAQVGMTGPVGILTAEDGGLFQAMSRSADITQLTEGLGVRWAPLEMDNKPYPCCRSTHGAIDAALELKRRWAIKTDQIESVHIDTYHVGKVQCATSRGSILPQTPMEAKFSTPYAVACALLRNGVGLSDFLPEQVLEPEVQALLEKVSVEEDIDFSKAYPQHWGCRMTIGCRDGTVYETSLTDASGSKDAPLTQEMILQKSTRMLSGVPGLNYGALQQSLLNLDNEEKIPILNRFTERKCILG